MPPAFPLGWGKWDSSARDIANRVVIPIHPFNESAGRDDSLVNDPS